MSETRHTPGLWLLKQYPRSRAYAITTDLNDAGRDIANVLGLVPESEANARLIAAAPTMYAFIERKATDGDAEGKAILEAIHANA